MSKRRASVLGKRGAGTHQPERVSSNRPAGEVKPIVSKSKHGKPMRYDFHDTDEVFLEMAAIRRGCLWFAGIMALLCLFMFCGAVVAQGQESPDIEFRSLFQIRYAMPDTVQIQHIRSRCKTGLSETRGSGSG